MSKISFVFFDVGGVLIKDFSETDKWEILKAELGATGDSAIKFESIFRDHNNQLVTGKIDAEKMLQIISTQLELTIPPNFKFLNYFVNHFEQNKGIWDIVEYAKSRARIGLLTDMYPGMLSEIRSAQLLPSISWDVIVDSSVEKVKKPFPEIYQIATDRAGVRAEEILFIDNKQDNLDGVKSAGWQTYFYDSSDYSQSNRELLEFVNQKL